MYLSFAPHLVENARGSVSGFIGLDEHLDSILNLWTEYPA